MWDHNTPSDAAPGRPPREGVSRNGSFVGAITSNPPGRPPRGGVSRNKTALNCACVKYCRPHAGAGVEISGSCTARSSPFASPPTRGRAKIASTERKRDDQSSPLPTKNFHPRISVNTRPSGIFLTEQLLNTYQLPNGCSPISVLSITQFLQNSTVRPNVQAVSVPVRRTSSHGGASRCPVYWTPHSAYCP